MTASQPQHAIAWINGTWGRPKELKLPLSDRGLQLADGLFETVLIHHQRPCLLDAHLCRWEQSCELLGMASPPTRPWLDPLIQEAIERLGLEQRAGALHLNWALILPYFLMASANALAVAFWWLPAGYIVCYYDWALLSVVLLVIPTQVCSSAIRLGFVSLLFAHRVTRDAPTRHGYRSDRSRR